MDKSILHLGAVTGRLWSVGVAFLLAWMLVVLTAADAQAAPLMQTGFDCSSATAIPTAECPAFDIPMGPVRRNIDGFVTLTDVRIKYWPIPTLLSPFGIVEIKAIMRNKCDCPIWDIVVDRVGGLNGNLLLKVNAPSGLDALSYYQSVSAVIGLWHLLPFPLDVSFVGTLIPGEIPFHVAGASSPLPIEVTVEALEAGRQEGTFYLERVYLPAVTH